MSNSTQSDKGNQPGSVASDIPPDPLLASGSFISSTTTVGNETLDTSAKRRPIQAGIEGCGSKESVKRNKMANGTDPSPVSSAHQSESKSRKRGIPVDNWLPPGWRVEDKVRTSGATAGSVDKYYFEPITGRRFRSRTEVLYYLEHGTTKKGSKNADLHSDQVEGQGNKKSSKKVKETPPPAPPLPPLNFDFENPPEKVSWSMGNTGEEAWTPFIGDDKVEELMRRDWCNAFTIITTQNPSKLS